MTHTTILQTFCQEFDRTSKSHSLLIAKVVLVVKSKDLYYLISFEKKLN